MGSRRCVPHELWHLSDYNAWHGVGGVFKSGLHLRDDLQFIEIDEI